MLQQKLNILLVNGDENLNRLVKGIFNAVDFDVTTVNGKRLSLKTFNQQRYHLTIVDLSSGSFTEETLQTIQLAYPELHFVLITNQSDEVDRWAQFKHINLISKEQVEVRLPTILSHFYSEFNQNLTSNLFYWKLIKTALEESSVFTAIVDQAGNILFLNRTAREILKITDETDSYLKFFEFLKEGEKVWQFLTMRWQTEKPSVIRMELQLQDIHFNEFHFPVSIYTVSHNQNYYIIQGKSFLEPELNATGNESETLLSAFSDSLANELLNPLNVIWGRLQLIQSNIQFSETDLHNIALIEKQLQRINEVVSKLVAFTSINRDLVPQRVFLHDVLSELLQQQSLAPRTEGERPAIQLNVKKNLPPVYGQAAHFELLFRTLFDLVLNLMGSQAQIQIDGVSSKENIQLFFKIDEFITAPDQVLLKSCLQFDQTSKKKFALEMTIIRYILDAYRIKHDLKEDASTLILSLVFPINNLQGG